MTNRIGRRVESKGRWTDRAIAAALAVGALTGAGVTEMLDNPGERQAYVAQLKDEGIPVKARVEQGKGYSQVKFTAQEQDADGNGIPDGEQENYVGMHTDELEDVNKIKNEDLKPGQEVIGGFIDPNKDA